MAQHEIETIDRTGGPNGGTFTVTAEDGTTSALAYNVTAAAFQAALRAASVKWAAATVVLTSGTGTNASPYLFTINSGANGTFTTLTVSVTNLTYNTTLTVMGEWT